MNSSTVFLIAVLATAAQFSGGQSEVQLAIPNQVVHFMDRRMAAELYRLFMETSLLPSHLTDVVVLVVGGALDAAQNAIDSAVNLVAGQIEDVMDLSDTIKTSLQELQTDVKELVALALNCGGSCGDLISVPSNVIGDAAATLLGLKNYLEAVMQSIREDVEGALNSSQLVAELQDLLLTIPNVLVAAIQDIESLLQILQQRLDNTLDDVNYELKREQVPFSTFVKASSSLNQARYCHAAFAWMVLTKTNVESPGGSTSIEFEDRTFRLLKKETAPGRKRVKLPFVRFFHCSAIVLVGCFIVMPGAKQQDAVWVRNMVLFSRKNTKASKPVLGSPRCSLAQQGKKSVFFPTEIVRKGNGKRAKYLRNVLNLGRNVVSGQNGGKIFLG
ncbi:unnamed protein product [Cyprideis torosa]|uniref:Uncharacterized protein n=1 Tax=Cyprideis torosa TaxID=163714 RepID=A0A7R8ZT62_9CRUS|nr:unnamed protein product [Cyprideis torosa]CAG0897299.1 unnamed protein product [Cyprideis torosa]